MNLPVRRVLLLEDRANVRRSGRLHLTRGYHHLRIDGASPILADKTLQAQILEGQATVLEIKVVRRPRPKNQRPGPLWDKIRAQRDLLASHERKVSGLALDLAGHQELLRHWAREVSQDAAQGRGDLHGWQADWTELCQRLTHISEVHARAKAERQEQQETLEHLHRQLQAAQSPADEIECEIHLQLTSDSDQELHIAIDYCLPNACWRPCHVAEWNGSNLRFRSQACLWQNTGEDWNDVELHFSTERSSLGTEPPELRPDLLQLRPKASETRVTVFQESVNEVSQPAVGVPGIDTGGEALRYQAPEAARVASDGRPYRVDLFEFEAPVEEEYVLLGDLSCDVFLQTCLSNRSAGAILAGPVDLIKGCGLVGKTYLKYVAAAQNFCLHWGPHPELRSCREVRVHGEEKSLLTGWLSKEYEVEVHVSNLGSGLQALNVLERIPVSELKNVKVEQNLKKTTDQVAHDEHGFLKFPVLLRAFGRKTIKLAYTVSRKKDVDGL